MSKKQIATNENSLTRTKKDSKKSEKPLNTEAQLLRAAREKEIIELLNYENMLKYLTGLTQNNNSRALIVKASDSAIENVGLSLQKGILQISTNPPPLPNKPIPIQKKSPEELRQLQIKTKREELQRKMEYLKQQIRGDANKIEAMHSNIKEVLSKEEHERKVKMFTDDWLEHKRKLDELREQQEEQQRKQIEEVKQKQRLKKIQNQKQAEAKRAQIQANMQQRKLQHEQFLKFEQKLKKQQVARNQKVLFQSKMSRHVQSDVSLTLLQERKKELKEIRDFKSKYSSQAVKEHEKQYISARSLSQAGRKTPEVKWQPPTRTKKLAKLLQFQQLQRKEQIEGRQQRLQEKAQRQEQFMQLLRAKHTPSIDPLKRKEVETRIIQERKKNQKATVDAKQLRQLGKQYLELSKKLIKPENQRNSQSKSKTTEEKSTASRINFLIGMNRSPDFYQNERRRKIEQIINSESVATEKYQLLQIESQKLAQKLKQQELLKRVRGDEDEDGELLLSSIKAKMGLVQLLNKQ